MKLRMGQAPQHLAGGRGGFREASACTQCSLQVGWVCTHLAERRLWLSVQNTQLRTEAERTLVRRTPSEAPSTRRSCLSQLG